MIMSSTRIFRADSISSIDESTTGIPITQQQRLIHNQKQQLQLDQTLAECGIQNHAQLQLQGDMQGIGHTRKLVNDVVSLAHYLDKNHNSPTKMLKSIMVEFLTMTPGESETIDRASEHFEIFASSPAPKALVMLYLSSHLPNRVAAGEAIGGFISFSKIKLPEHTHHRFAPVVFEFCSLLSKEGITSDPLYSLCWTTLQSILKCSECGAKKMVFSLQIRFSFFKELVTDLSRDLDLCVETTNMIGPSSTLVRDFTDFIVPVTEEIKENFAFRDPIAIPLSGKLCGAPVSYTEEIIYLHGVFIELLSKLEKCLVKTKLHWMKMDRYADWEKAMYGIEKCLYLPLLKGLNSISKLYSGCEEVFWKTLKQHKCAISCLVYMNAMRCDDYSMIFEFKEVMNFPARRFLAMRMLPKETRLYEWQQETLIDRSHLLAESFEYIVHLDSSSLRSGLFMEFKNEQATGCGVLREWFFLVCQEIANPQNSLFLACPKDRRRIFPNPASSLDPLHLEYFSFCGRVIALALMHNIQVGIVFDRVFFLQLAGLSISLEDIQDADPYLYRSCKQILEMDPEVLDQDVLGLTFVHEIEELGTRNVFELCPNGRNVVVNSENRNQFVDSLIQHRFVTAISEQIAHFARGFSDIMSCRWRHQSFFRCLVLEDLDCILHGSESAISVDDWKAHTDYRGFKETDPQISWFWEIVGLMSVEQKRILLFFWTSIKYLPLEGFSGLASRLCIHRTVESCDHLPSSHTCFYMLLFPAYRSFNGMRDRLNTIAQEHVCCSFGNE